MSKMGRRKEKYKKTRRPIYDREIQDDVKNQRVSCFVCDDEITLTGVPLLASHTTYSKTGFPAKIGELMGDGFMVVVSVGDTLCRQCSSLLNVLDKLEIEIGKVKNKLVGYLKVKYQLTDENLARCHAEFISQEDIPNTERGTDCEILEETITIDDYDEVPLRNKDSNHKDLLLIEESKEIPCQYRNGKNEAESGSTDSTTSGNLTIISQNTSTKQKTHESYRSSDSCQFLEEAAQMCKSSQDMCRICGKVFKSAKSIQIHMMRMHHSKNHYHHTNIADEKEHLARVHNHLHVPKLKVESACPQDNDNILRNYDCNICDFRSSDKILAENHLRHHIAVKLHKCEACEVRFEDEVLLAEHTKVHHKQDMIVCVACSQEFQTNEDLLLHMESHYDELICDIKSLPLSEWDVEDSASANNSTEHTENSAIDKRLDIRENSESTKFVSQVEITGNIEINKCDDDIHDKTMKPHTNSSCSQVFVNDKFLEEDTQCCETVTEDGLRCTNSGTSCDNSSTHHVTLLPITDRETEVCLSHEYNMEPSDSTTHDSFEDMIAKMNSQSEESYEAQGKEGLPQYCKIKGNISREDTDVDSLENHIQKRTCYEISSASQLNTLPDTNSHTEVAIPNNVEDNSTKNTSKIVCEEKVSTVDSTDSCELESENPFKLKTEDFDLVTKEEVNTYVNINDTIPEQKAVSVKKAHACFICDLNPSETGTYCKMCKQCFPSSVKLGEHMEHDHGISSATSTEEKQQKIKKLQSHQCKFCAQKFSTRKACERHEETHSERLLYSCIECDKNFTREKQLTVHRNTYHRDPHCKFCGKEILNMKALRNHEGRHVNRKDQGYECKVCSRVYQTKTGLRHHTAVHTGEYKYCCEHCGRGFMSRMMMEEHRSMHTKEERYVCDVCGRKFTFQSTYWIHRKWHDNPYPYKCSFCGRVFRHSSLLAVHKRKHTGERPYKCPHCPLSFPVGGTLKRHLILHTGIYPFNCEHCQQGFTTRHKYTTHLAKTHGDFQLVPYKPSKNDFKMVIREDTEPSENEDDPVQDSQQAAMTFKFAVTTDAGSDGLDLVEPINPCSISDNFLSDRVVEIVLDESAQVVVTLADPLPEPTSASPWFLESDPEFDKFLAKATDSLL